MLCYLTYENSRRSLALFLENFNTDSGKCAQHLDWQPTLSFSIVDHLLRSRHVSHVHHSNRSKLSALSNMNPNELLFAVGRRPDVGAGPAGHAGAGQAGRLQLCAPGALHPASHRPGVSSQHPPNRPVTPAPVPLGSRAVLEPCWAGKERLVVLCLVPFILGLTFCKVTLGCHYVRTPIPDQDSKRNVYRTGNPRGPISNFQCT